MTVTVCLELEVRLEHRSGPFVSKDLLKEEIASMNEIQGGDEVDVDESVYEVCETFINNPDEEGP